MRQPKGAPATGEVIRALNELLDGTGEHQDPVVHPAELIVRDSA